MNNSSLKQFKKRHYSQGEQYDQYLNEYQRSNRNINSLIKNSI